MPLISIILPTYNAEKYLSESIGSILRQTFTNFELIIIDDGSTDNTKAILNSYSSEDKRLQCHFCNHQGAANARNYGLQLATGKYIMFIDSDDIYHKDMLHHMFTKAVQTNADMTICSYRKFDNTTKKTLWEFRTPRHFLVYDRVETCEHEQDIFSIVPGSPWGKLIKKEIINNHEIKFQNLSSCNDFYFSYAVICLCSTIAICDQILIYYRSGISGSISEKRGLHCENIVYAINALYLTIVNSGKFEQLKKSFIARSRESLKFELSKANETKRTEVKSLIFNMFNKDLALELATDILN